MDNRNGATKFRQRECKPRGELLEDRWVWAFLFWKEFWAEALESTPTTEIPTYHTEAADHKEFDT